MDDQVYPTISTAICNVADKHNQSDLIMTKVTSRRVSNYSKNSNYSKIQASVSEIRGCFSVVI